MLTYIRENGCQVIQTNGEQNINDNNDNKDENIKQLQSSLDNLNKEKEIWTQKSVSLSQNVMDLERDLLKERELTEDLQVLFAPTGQSTLLDRGNYKANTQILIAELDAAKDLNKKLSLQFAKAEKDLERLKTEHKLQKDKMNTPLATKLAVEDLHQHHPQHKTLTDKQCQTINVTTNSHDPLSSVSLTSAALLSSSSGSDLSPSDIQANCELMLTYIREKGCQMTQTNAEKNINNNNANKDDHIKE